MAQKIRGVTVEIGGDTSGLQKSLKDVNSAISSTARQLRDVNNLLKLDPGNTELLKQKQTLLASEIDAVKKKIEEEKAALAQMNEESGTDAATEGQMALQRDIIASEQKLKDLEKEARECSSVLGEQFKVAGEQIGAAGDKIGSVGQALMPVTAAISAAGAASVVAWNEVDSGLDTIIKKTGASGDALEEMQGIMENIATSIPTDFDTAANAVGEVNTRFGLTGDALESLSTQFIQFAELNGTDVSSSIDTVQAAMAAFGVSAEEAGVFLDTLNKAGQDTGINVDTLAQSMTTNAATLKEFGYSASDSAMFIANLNKQGLDTSAVMAGMKKAFTNSINEGKSLDEAMADLNKSMAEADSSTEAYEAAIDLFGSKTGPALVQAINEGRLSFEDLNTSMSDFAGNVSDTFESTLDPLDEFDTTMNELKLVGAELVDAAAPLITDVLVKAKEVVGELRDYLTGLSDEEKEHIIQIAGIVAAVGPVLIILGKIITGVGALVTSIGAIMPVITAIGAFIGGTLIPAIGAIVVALGPVLLIIAAVVAAVIGVIAIIKNWGAISEWLAEKWSEAKEKIAEIWESMKETASAAFEKVKEAVVTVFTNLFNAAPGWAQNLITGYINIIKAEIALVKRIFTDLKEKGIKQTFIDLINDAKKWGIDMIQQFIDGIRSMISKVGDAVRGVADKIKSFLGFSLPETGPLSKANTWMPDMMQLLAQTIENSIGLLDPALNDTAQRIAELSNINLATNNSDIINYLAGALPGLGNQQIVLDTGALVGQTVGQYDKALGKLYQHDQRSV